MVDAPEAGGAKGRIENPTHVLILGFVTCGIYSLYWLWLRLQEMNEYLGKQQVNPMFIVPGFLCGPFVICAEVLFVRGLPEMQRKAGIDAKDEFAMDFILLLFLAPVGQYVIQQKMNAIWAK